MHPARQNHLATDRKSPKSLLSQQLTRERRRSIIRCAFVLPSRYGMAIMEIRGAVPLNFHTFLCTTYRGCPVMAGLDVPGRGLPDLGLQFRRTRASPSSDAIHVFLSAIPGSRF